MVAEERSGYYSRTQRIDIIDLGLWHEKMVKAIFDYQSGD